VGTVKEKQITQVRWEIRISILEYIRKFCRINLYPLSTISEISKYLKNVGLAPQRWFLSSSYYFGSVTLLFLVVKVIHAHYEETHLKI